MKDVIRQAVAKVKTGKGTNEDKAIVHLLEKCKDLQFQLKSIQRNGMENPNVPVHQSTPWYMQ